MLFGIVFSLLFVTFFIEEYLSLKKLKRNCEAESKKVSQKYSSLKKGQKVLKGKVSRLEGSLSERFLLYDLTRKIAPLLNKEELLSAFIEEIGHLGKVDMIRFSSSNDGTKGVLRFELGKGKEEALEVSTKSKNVIEYMPYFVKLLRLCLERVHLKY